MTPAFALVYKPSMRILRLDDLPPPRISERYLLVTTTLNEPNTFIAVAWTRVASQPQLGYELIDFGP